MSHNFCVSPTSSLSEVSPKYLHFLLLPPTAFPTVKSLPDQSDAGFIWRFCSRTLAGCGLVYGQGGSPLPIPCAVPCARLRRTGLRLLRLAQMFTINKLKPQNRHDFSFGKQKGRLSPAVRVNVGLGEEEGAALRPIAPNLSRPPGARSGVVLPPVGPVSPKAARGSLDAGGRSGSFPAQHRSIQVIHSFPFKPGCYLYLARQNLLLGPVSQPLGAFPLMPSGSSPEQMSFSLGNEAAAPNLGQTSGLLSICVHGSNAIVFPHHAGTAPA